MKFLNCFPDELEIGDVWGERGEIIERTSSQTSMTYKIVCRQPQGSTWVENHWPYSAPLRVGRPDV